MLVQIYINGVHVGEINRNTESTYTAFSLHGYSVETLALTATASEDYKWVSLLEVSAVVVFRCNLGLLSPMLWMMNVIPGQ